VRFIDAVELYTDGGCRGNPGPGAIGVMIVNNSHEVLLEHSECIGQTTNNRAEYRALIKGLDLCAKFTRGRVCCYCDSELVIKQMTGEFRLNDDTLRSLYHQVQQLRSPFKEVVFQHVRRTNGHIKKADRLLNDAFEGRSVSRRVEPSKPVKKGS
jgi:ribonuclease HI